MFGAYRLFLSLVVMNGHLYTPWYPAAYAVYGFFILSGYLMTLIMNTRYGYSIEGRKLYVINRFLRIYPPYYMAVAFSLLLLFFVPPEFIHKFNNKIAFPLSVADILKNMCIFGLDKAEPVRLVPLAWALHIELFYYVAIGLFMGKSKKIALIWLGGSLSYVTWLLLSGNYEFSLRYEIIPAAALPFSIGVCLFHFRETIKRILRKVFWEGAMSVSLLLYLFSFYVPQLIGKRESIALHSGMVPFYLNIFLAAILIAVLSNMPRNRYRFFKKIDAFLGSLSYPIYLFHFQSAILAAYLVNLNHRGKYLLLYGGAVAIFLAILEARFLSNNIERLRDKYKKRLRS